MSATATMTAGEMGRRGECAVQLETEKIYIPYILPSEVARISRAGKRARVEEILSTSTARVAPFCCRLGI